MDRGVWLVAAWMVSKFGPNAPVVVDRKLAAMERGHVDERRLLIWCQIGRAVLEIIKNKPEARETVH
jgi:hypothetical protein